MHTGTWLEIYTPDGALIGRVLCKEQSPDTNEGYSFNNHSQSDRKEREKENGEKMTAPQQRLLFRLLATDGIEGDRAYDELKKIFRVKSLQDVSKREASKTIERMIEKGGNGNGSSLK